WRQPNHDANYSQTLELNLATVLPSVAGPRRPQDRVDVRGVKQSFRSALADVFKKEIGQSVTPRLDRWSSEALSPAALNHQEDAREADATQRINDQAQTATLQLDDRWM